MPDEARPEFLQFTAQSTQNVWGDGADLRTIYAKRREYYDGDQDILDEDEDRYDGGTRNLVVTNWIEYVVDRHVGFLTDKPVSYTIREVPGGRPDEEAVQQQAAMDGLADVIRDNNLDAVDAEHLGNAILFGSGVEVHSMDAARNIVIKSYSPENWVFLEDVDGKAMAAVYKAEVAANRYYNGEILENPVTLYTVYTARSITTYREQDTIGVDGKTVSAIVEVSAFEHHYGRLPVVRFGVTKTFTSFITTALLTQQDVYNTIRSLNADDVEYNVSALLKLKGYDPTALFEEDDDGVRFIDKMRQHHILPLTVDGEADFITKGNETDKVRHDLDVSRSDIHMMGKLADIDKIVGATGNTSGIALKLKLQPQIDQSSTFVKYFTVGLRERIDLINVMHSKLKRPQLTDYDVAMSLSIPINEIEIWQSIPNLDHLLAKEDQLKLIPSVSDPAAAAEAKREEEQLALENMPIPEEMGEGDEEFEEEEDAGDEEE